MASSITATWSRLGTQKVVVPPPSPDQEPKVLHKPVYFTITPLYDFTSTTFSKLNLRHFLWSCSGHGGAMAMCRDPRQALLVTGGALFGGSSRSLAQLNAVSVYSSAARRLATLNIAEGESVIWIGWIDGEKLVYITNRMKCRVFDVSGCELFRFSLDDDLINQMFILKIESWADGIVILARSNELANHSKLQVWVVMGFKDHEPKCTCLGEISQKARAKGLPSITPEELKSLTPQSNISLAVILPNGIHENLMEIDVWIGFPEQCQISSGLVVMNAVGCKSHMTGQGPFRKIAVSPTHDAVAAVAHSNGRFTLNIFDSHLSRTLGSFTQEGLAPDDLAWVGQDAVGLYWDSDTIKDKMSLLLIFGPKMDMKSFQFPGSVRLFQEIDGLRIVENSKCSFLHRVPVYTQDIFSLGSIEPAAMVFDAYQEFADQNNASSTIKNFRTIPDLPRAVDACLKAATNEFDTELQTKLLKAASYSKSFSQCGRSFNHDKFVHTCKTLRVLNAVRKPKVGVPLTYPQFLRLTPAGLINRLIARHHHYLALKICEYLSLQSEKARVLVHWACAKVLENDQDDDEILKAIEGKLSKKDNVSFAAVAATAFRNNRKKLAIDLLKNEPLAGEQVPLLLRMNQHQLALSKAIESGETDLIYLVLLEMKQAADKANLASIIENPEFDIARNLLISYCKEQDIDFLKRMYEILEFHSEAANMFVLQSCQVPPSDLSTKRRLLIRAKDMYVQDKNFYEDAKSTENQIKLLDIQDQLNEKFGKAIFTGLSISDTIYHLIFMSDQYPEFLKQALALKKEFKVSDRRFWWIKIRALSKSQRWESLEQFANAKKSPIGYRPFAEVCLNNGNEKEASKYVPLVTDVFEKGELYVQIGEINAAMQLAFTKKDVKLLKIIYPLASNEQKQIINAQMKQF